MPDQITRLLDQIDRLGQQATQGPWLSHCGGNPHDEWLSVEPEKGSRTICTVTDDHQQNAEFISLARDALPKLAKALRAVMEVHTPEEFSDHEGDGVMCNECMYDDGTFMLYPCPTVQAITDAMEGDDE